MHSEHATSSSGSSSSSGSESTTVETTTRIGIDALEQEDDEVLVVTKDKFGFAEEEQVTRKITVAVRPGSLNEHFKIKEHDNTISTDRFMKKSKTEKEPAAVVPVVWDNIKVPAVDIHGEPCKYIIVQRSFSLDGKNVQRYFATVRPKTTPTITKRTTAAEEKKEIRGVCMACNPLGVIVLMDSDPSNWKRHLKRHRTKDPLHALFNSIVNVTQFTMNALFNMTLICVLLILKLRVMLLLKQQNRLLL
jgi:inorganic pyrophosphatase